VSKLEQRLRRLEERDDPDYSFPKVMVVYVDPDGTEWVKDPNTRALVQIGQEEESRGDND